MAKGAKVIAKGVKRIQLVVGEYYAARSKGNLLVLAGGVDGSFNVVEWLPDTSEADKKNLVWMLEDAQRTKVLLENRSQVLSQINIPKELCGNKPLYYLEASLSNKINKNISNGYLIVGHCKPLIKEAIWSAEKDGPRLGKTPKSYGEDIYLKLTTEGLNGNNLMIEIYQRKYGKDKGVRNIAAECVNGEVNLFITNTFSWYDVMKNGPDTGELFIKVKSDGIKDYILDSHGDDAHARFLRMENKVVSRVTSIPKNITVAKVGDQLPHPGRTDHCRFNKLVITDGADPVILFDEGKMKLLGETNKEFFLDEKVFYGFNKYNLTPEAKAVLDKMASILMEMPFVPVELGSHTDRFGSDAINRTLSDNRAKTAMDYLISKNVDASRITSKGYGKTMLVNKDANLSKEASSVNRRTTIRLRIFSHDAQSLIFETIQPGITYKKELQIMIGGLHTKGLCNVVSNPHIEDIPYSEITPSNKKGRLKLNAEIIKPEVYSPMDNVLTGFDYLFPHLRQPNNFYFYINTCAYFSDKEKPSLIVKAYSDIKWEFKFFLDMSSPLNVGWSNGAQMSESRLNELRKSAEKLGKAHYDQTTGIDFGVQLNSNWNKSGGVYKGHEEYTLKFQKEITAFYKLISSVKEITRGITSGTGGSPRKKEFGSGIPVIVKVLAPKFALGIEWKLARGSKNKIKTEKIGTEYRIYFSAEPLIGVEFTVDLLQLVVQGVSLATTGNTAAADVFNVVRDWAERGYKSKKVEVSLDMYIDLILKGEIKGGVSDVIINTASDNLEVKGELATKITGTLTAGVNLKAKAVIVEAGPNKTDIHATGSISAKISVGITATHSFNYDTHDGLYYRPGLVMDPCEGKVVIMVDVGFNYRKISADWTPINIDDKREFWESFDVMKKLEKVSGISPNFTIIPRKTES